MAENYRGSQKHLLDLLELEQPNFTEIFNGLLSGTGATVSVEDARQPTGYDDPKEEQVGVFGGKHLDGQADWEALKGWWPKRGPQWDLLIPCSFENGRGLVLVEAKAHEGELDWKGKGPADESKQESLDNHELIARSIAEATKALDKKMPGFGTCRDKHYQLSNRIAHMWKLADMGLPVVLLYLGFTGDTYFKNDYLRDDDHWQRVMGGYMHKVVPQEFPGQTLSFASGGSATMLVKALPVKEVSVYEG